MRVYIDTNIFLSFIEASKETGSSLDKLKELVESKQVVLVFPEITRDEILRRIPGIVNTYVAKFSNCLPKKPEIPSNIRNEKKGIERINKIHTAYKNSLKALEKKYIEDVENFYQDTILGLYNLSKKFDESESILKKAFFRRLKGNPPGYEKKASDPIGDEVVWEILLDNCHDDDLSIVTRDNDWIDPYKKQGAINDFIAAEWMEKSKKRLYQYKTLGDFINNFSKKELVSAKTIVEESRSYTNMNESIKKMNQVVEEYNRVLLNSKGAYTDYIKYSDQVHKITKERNDIFHRYFGKSK